MNTSNVFTYSLDKYVGVGFLAYKMSLKKRTCQIVFHQYLGYVTFPSVMQENSSCSLFSPTIDIITLLNFSLPC